MTGSSYGNLLERQFFFAIKKNAVDEYWFMQDSTMPHHIKDVFDSIFDCFNTRVIGLNYLEFANGGLEWPPYSPDLNPLDFFLWDYLKDKVYENNPETLSALKKQIIFEIDNIEVDVLPRVIQNFCKRLELCQEGDGSHFAHIYV